MLEDFQQKIVGKARIEIVIGHWVVPFVTGFGDGTGCIDHHVRIEEDGHNRVLTCKHGTISPAAVDQIRAIAVHHTRTIGYPADFVLE
jgi:hypothetical protein